VRSAHTIQRQDNQPEEMLHAASLREACEGLAVRFTAARRFFRAYPGMLYCVQVVLIIFSVSTRKSAVSRLLALFSLCVSSPCSSSPSART
jgi:hypothetical protein